MKYNELDLHNLLPYGIPVNTADHVEPTGHINEFFLSGFTAQYEIVQDFAPGCSAPYSLEANRICSDAILKRFVEEAGAEYYPVNHEILAQFTQSLYTIPLGSLAIVNALVQYACENNDVVGEIESTGVPHVYDIAVSGDIVGSSLTTDIVNRLERNLNNFLPASEQWHGFNFTEEDEAEVYAGASVLNADELSYIKYTGTRLGWVTKDRTAKTIDVSTTNYLYNTFNGGSTSLSATIVKVSQAINLFEIESITFADGTTDYDVAKYGLSLSKTSSNFVRLTTQSRVTNALYVSIRKIK